VAMREVCWKTVPTARFSCVPAVIRLQKPNTCSASSQLPCCTALCVTFVPRVVLGGGVSRKFLCRGGAGGGVNFDDNPRDKNIPSCFLFISFKQQEKT